MSVCSCLVQSSYGETPLHSPYGLRSRLRRLRNAETAKWGGLSDRDPNDADSDMVCGDVDSCVHDNLNDVDSDLLCHGDDHCPYDVDNDADSDGVCGDIDSCLYDLSLIHI